MNRIGVGSVHHVVEVTVAAVARSSRGRSGLPVGRPRHAAGAWWALALWVAVIVAARVVLVDLVQSGAHVRIPFPPLDASLDWRPGGRCCSRSRVAVVLVARAPAPSRARASWRVLLVGSTVVAAGGRSRWRCSTAPPAWSARSP